MRSMANSRTLCWNICSSSERRVSGAPVMISVAVVMKPPGGVVSPANDIELGAVMMRAAPVAKLADARDLKSLASKGACRFESGPGHHLVNYLTFCRNDPILMR